MIYLRDFLVCLAAVPTLCASSVVVAQENPRPGVPPTEAPTAIFEVDRAGVVFLAGSRMEHDQISAFCAQLAETSTNPRVRLQCDPGLPLKKIKEIVKILGDAGITNLSFATTSRSLPAPEKPATIAPPPPVKVAIPEGTRLTADDILAAAAMLAKGGTVEVTYPSTRNFPITLYDPEPLRGWDVVLILLTTDDILYHGEEPVTRKVLQEKLELIDQAGKLTNSTASIYLMADDDTPSAQLFPVLDLLSQTGIHVHPVSPKEPEPSRKSLQIKSTTP